MCQYFDPASFMATVFSVCPAQSSVDFATLRKLRDHLTEKLDSDNVVIDWTRNAVMEAMVSYPDMFEDLGDKVNGCSVLPKEELKTFLGHEGQEEFFNNWWDAVKEGCEAYSIQGGKS